MTDITQILNAVEQCDPAAAAQLLPLVYDELRKLAVQKMAQEAPGHTLQATALVHEAYIWLVDVDRSQWWDSRGHFFAAAAEAMGRILVETARRKQRGKHGGELRRLELTEHASVESDDGLVAVDEALTLLAAEDPQAAKVLELRCLAGLGHDAVAATLNITVYQARQKWTYARAWLRDFLGAGG